MFKFSALALAFNNYLITYSLLKRILKRLKIAAASLLIFQPGMAQTSPSSTLSLGQPLEGTMVLSANFGELRPEHFHSGIDVKVGGVVGAKLLSVADGYIWRVSVSPSGYGKAVYIKHHNGLMSVYGHLNDFSPQIKSFIRQIQYSRQRFAVDTTLHSELLPVKKGELIGFAGNSGSSFGAHLHFELRNEENMPLNPADFYKLADNISPELHGLRIYTLDSIRSVPHKRLTHRLDLKAAKGAKKVDSIIHIESPAYFALEVIDRMPNTHNKFGVRRMRMILDDVELLAININNVPFSQNRYINSLIAYDEKANSGRSFIKTYLEPGNQLDIYNTIKESGLVKLNDYDTHKLSLVVEDDFGNSSTLSCRIQQKKVKGKPVEDNNGKLMMWNEDNFHITDDFFAYIPKGALYNSILFTSEKLDTLASGSLSPVYKVCHADIPLHLPMGIAIKANIPDSLSSKAVMLRYSGSSKKISCLGGEWVSGLVSASTYSFGSFYVALDTVAPTITPSFKKGADVRNQKSLRVKIKDNLSGINTYNGFIDNQWVLFDYDAKNNVLVYEFDANRTKRGQKHTLMLEVSDKKGNVAVLHTDFRW